MLATEELLVSKQPTDRTLVLEFNIIFNLPVPVLIKRWSLNLIPGSNPASSKMFVFIFVLPRN